MEWLSVDKKLPQVNKLNCYKYCSWVVRLVGDQPTVLDSLT